MRFNFCLVIAAMGMILSLWFNPSQGRIGLPGGMSSIRSDTLPPDPCNDYIIRWYEDTLFRTTETDLTYFPNPNALVRKIPFKNGFVGVFIGYHYDDFVAVYQCDSTGRWQRTFCGKGEGGEDFTVTMPDLNFDGYPDLLIDGDTGGLRGNHFAIGFLFDPIRQSFQRYPALDLENLLLDVHTRQLRSIHYGSIYGACIKQLYAWEKDSIVLLEEALYHADADSAYIAFKHRMPDGMVKPEELKGKREPLWQFFVDFALWEGF